MEIFSFFMFFTVPILSLVYFIISLCWFFSARKHFKNEPTESNRVSYKSGKVNLIVSSAITLVLIAIIIAIAILLSFAIAYM